MVLEIFFCYLGIHLPLSNILSIPPSLNLRLPISYPLLPLPSILSPLPLSPDSEGMYIVDDGYWIMDSVYWMYAGIVNCGFIFFPWHSS